MSEIASVERDGSTPARASDDAATSNEGAPLQTLVYISSARIEMEPLDLRGILDKARRNNARDGVTGALLYAEGGFIQVLEGPPEKVAATFERIKRDRRHHSVTVMFDEPVADRAFRGWDMGFMNADEQTPEAFPLSRSALEDRMTDLASEEVRTLLRRFCVSAYPHMPD
ncbi:MAG: BLUF domain-containing protein [Pseudomonadota bacterium]